MDDTKWFSPIVRQRLTLALFLSLFLLVYLKLRAAPILQTSVPINDSIDFMVYAQESEVIDLDFTN
ncbi:MAG: hypothetical protein RJB66_1422 [Pseudomonadota bacterium]|jgi:hypothetical protein